MAQRKVSTIPTKPPGMNSPREGMNVEALHLASTLSTTYTDQMSELSTEPSFNADEEGVNVGFANLPTQILRKTIKRGFEFSLMVVGMSGLGKSTFVNCMFRTNIYSVDHPGPSYRIKKTTSVEATKVFLQENGVSLVLTVIDTPGFGDQIDNSRCWEPIVAYIDQKYEEYLNDESKVNRTKVEDNRVHCCLYFLAPSGHSMRPLDIEVMKALHEKVNVVPVIAKADTLTPEECGAFKKTVLRELAENKIKIYDFPDIPGEDDRTQLAILKSKIPFAIVSSVVMVDSNGRTFQGRKYPWGTVDVENIDHSDFSVLKNLLLRNNMKDMIDVTNNFRYEMYRSRKLAEMGADGQKSLCPANKNPLAQMEEEKREHEAKIKKMEQEMEQVFELKVREKLQKLKNSEFDLQKREEQMKKTIEHQRHELEERRRAFEREKVELEARFGDPESNMKKKLALEPLLRT